MFESHVWAGSRMKRTSELRMACKHSIQVKADSKLEQKIIYPKLIIVAAI